MRVRHRDPREFDKWLDTLGPRAQESVLAKLVLVADGQWPTGLPLVRYLGGRLFELRVIAHGLRLYFIHSDTAILFLAYGRKDTQDRDIAKARR